MFNKEKLAERMLAGREAHSLRERRFVSGAPRSRARNVRSIRLSAHFAHDVSRVGLLEPGCSRVLGRAWQWGETGRHTLHPRLQRVEG